VIKKRRYRNRQQKAGMPGEGLQRLSPVDGAIMSS
jgi:hypothetical protein